MAGYIPKEQLASYQRWQLGSFDEPGTPAPAAAAAPPAAPPPAAAPEGDPGSGEIVSGIALPTAEDIERIHAEAREAGFEEGRQAGYAAGLEATRAETERMAALAGNLARALADMDQAIADEVLALAIELSGQVLRRTIETDADYLLPIVREALAALPLHHGHVMLHANPADTESLRRHLGNQFSQAGWHIVDDPQVELGGCFLRAGSSEVDATLATRWKRVLEAIGVGATEPPEER